MTRKAKSMEDIFSEPRFMVSPAFLPAGSDHITCPECGKRALRHIGIWAETVDADYMPVTVHIYSCKWCKKVYREEIPLNK